MNERESMPDSYESTEDLQEPSQLVCPALPVQPPDVQAPPDSVPVAALTGDQENLSILNGHQNFFVPALSDADHQVMILHVSNGTFQQTEQDGVVKSDGAEDSPTNTQTWQVFSHEIRVKTGLPGTETWSQENGHNGKLSFDTLELEEATLSQENGHNSKLSFDTLELEEAPLSQENGHNGKLSFDTLELEEATLKRTGEEGQALAQPATDEQFEFMRYAEWLTTEAKRNNNGSHQEESNKYAEDALKTVPVKGQECRPFAPFQQALSASKTLTRGQAVILSTLMLGCGLGLLFYGMKLFIVIIALITLLYLSSLLLDFWLIMLALNQSTEEQIEDEIVHALADADWPQYTILCPLYRETEVVPQFVQAMQALDYPADKLQILFLTEEDDMETRKAIAAMHLPQHFSIVTVPAGQPRTKPRACNFGLLQATGDYVVIYDAEDIPDPLQLKKAVLTFANHDSDLACVQAKLNYYNPNQNLLTRWFTVEYSLWFDLMLPGMQQAKLPLPLGGTSNHFRIEMLLRIGGWDPFNVTEDCDLGLRLARSGLKTIVLDSTTYEEANSQVKNWIRQRSRWIKGYLLTYLVYMREPLRYLRRGRLREFLSLQLVIGGKTVVTLQLPAFTSTKHVSPLLPASRLSSRSTAETGELESKVAVQLPAFTSAERLSVRRPKRPAWQQWLKDPWLIAAFVVACIASSASCWYFFQQHQLLLYGDAISHLRIARRVFDNTTPGLAQLGGVWLPLPHLLMLPFVWNDYLWRTGLAGSFPSMLCYLVAVVYLFLSARRLTQDSRASFVGTLLFILNPNILYLQSTPLSETVCIATSVMACYYFLAWTQDNHPKHLVGVAAGTFLATLSRFDGWGLFLVLLVLLVVVGWIKRQHLAQVEGTLIVFVTLAGLGIGLWFLWGWVIFGDTLYFHHFLYSSAADARFYTYHNLLQSILSYMLTSIETVGPILFVLAAIAVVVFVFRRRLAPDMFGAIAFLTPFVFYILIFYFGQDTIYVPGVGPANTWHYLWNVRFGVQAVAPAALFLAILARLWPISMPARIML